MAAQPTPRRWLHHVRSFSSLGLAAVTLGNLGAADGDLLEAFNQSDIVLRVLLIVGALASLVVLILAGRIYHSLPGAAPWLLPSASHYH